MEQLFLSRIGATSRRNSTLLGTDGIAGLALTAGSVIIGLRTCAAAGSRNAAIANSVNAITKRDLGMEASSDLTNTIHLIVDGFRAMCCDSCLIQYPAAKTGT